MKFHGFDPAVSLVEVLPREVSGTEKNREFNIFTSERKF